MVKLSSATTAMAYAVKELVGGQWSLNFYTHLNEELGFIYFACPGVANYRTIGSLNQAVAEAMGSDFRFKQISQLNNRKANILGNPRYEGYDVFDEMLDDPHVMKFTFLRDPAERFSSNYTIDFSAKTQRSKQRIKLFEYLGIPNEENLSMLDLAELLVEEEGIKSLLPQLRNQRQMVAFDLVAYDFIGRHENWESDFARISNNIFGREISQFNPMQEFNKDPEGMNLMTLVSDEVKEVLKIAYAEDYEMLEEVAELFPNGYAQHHE